MENDEHLSVCAFYSKVSRTCCVAEDVRKDTMTVISEDEYLVICDYLGKHSNRFAHKKTQYIESVSNSVSFYEKIVLLIFR
jgi:hypothetical protein